MTFFYRIVLYCCLISLVFSCKTTKRSAYFQDISDTIRSYPVVLPKALYSDPLIRIGDVLQITVQTNASVQDVLHGNNTLNNTYQEPQTSQSSLHGYKVDKDGCIIFPVIGKIKSTGLTTHMIRDSIFVRASKYFKDPIVNVHLANFTITVLGEVGRPGNYTLQNEKVSLLEALGFAGDLTIYAKKENVLLVREDGNIKRATRLDLTSSESFASDYFYLKQGDVIYVEPNKARVKIANEGAKTRNYAIAASALSVLIVLISRLSF